VLLDEKDLRTGLPWQELLEQAIKDCGSVAVCIAADGLGPWQEEEIRAALHLAVKDGCPIIPVLLSGAPSKLVLPLFLVNRGWVDFPTLILLVLLVQENREWCSNSSLKVLRNHAQRRFGTDQTLYLVPPRNPEADEAEFSMLWVGAPGWIHPPKVPWISITTLRDGSPAASGCSYLLPASVGAPMPDVSDSSIACAAYPMSTATPCVWCW